MSGYPEGRRSNKQAGPILVTALLILLCFLFLVSLFLGAGDMSLAALLRFDSEAWQLLLISRLPRALALVLAGTSLAVAGLIMQMLVRNRFVEPSTAGTVESATMGILAVTLLAPGISVLGKMLVAALFALAGTSLFLLILRRIPLRSAFLVPVVGLVLGASYRRLPPSLLTSTICFRPCIRGPWAIFQVS